MQSPQAAPGKCRRLHGIQHLLAVCMWMSTQSCSKLEGEGRLPSTSHGGRADLREGSVVASQGGVHALDVDLWRDIAQHELHGVPELLQDRQQGVKCTRPAGLLNHSSFLALYCLCWSAAQQTPLQEHSATAVCWIKAQHISFSMLGVCSLPAFPHDAS